MEKQIKLFLEFLENDKRVSKNTLESYRRDIMQYADYIEENHMNYTKIDNEEIEEYLDYLKEEGKKASTISRNLASIRSFYQYLIRTKKNKKMTLQKIYNHQK